MQNNPERWMADYERDGYVVVENCLDPGTLAKAQAAVATITDAPDKVPTHLQRWLT